MAAPKVNVSTIDQSSRVPGFPGVIGGLVIPAVKGSTTELELITDENDLLNRLTANGKIEIGYDNSYWSALAFLASANRLYVARASNTALYGGAIIKSSPAVAADAAWSVGMADPLTYSFNATPIVAAAEVTRFNCEADTTRSLDGDYIEFSSPTIDYYAWFCVQPAWVALAAKVVGSIVVPTTPVHDANGVSLVYRSTTIGTTATPTEPTWPTTIGGTVVDATVTWEAISAATASVDPAPIGRYGKAITIPTNAANTLVATNLKAVIDHYTGIFTSTAVGNAWTVTNVATGTVSNAPNNGGTGWVVNPVITAEGTNASSTSDAFSIYALNPGDWNNDIAVQIYNYRNSPTVVKEPGAFMISVYYQSTLVESWVCSLTEGTVDGYGNNIFVEDVLLQSDYVRGYSASSGLLYPKEQTTNLTFAYGSDGSTVTDSNMITALGLFNNTNDAPITLMMDGGWATRAYQRAVDSLCSTRGDCVSILSIPYAAESASNYISAITTYRNVTLNLNSSWSAIYSPHVLINDKYNNRELYVSPDGYAGAVISRTFANYELWYPAAGFRRGLIDVLDVRRRYTDGEMDSLYDIQINPIRFAIGRGILIWGQKTLTSRPSSLDRLNVRLLLVYIQPAIKKVLEDFLFEFNDSITRSQVTAIINDYMEGIQARRGVYAYNVVCDTSNNTPVVIDNNEMYVDLYIQPTKSVETIYFRTIITRTGVTI